MASQPSPQIERVYIPFGEWNPDQAFFSNSGLIQAQNVIPVYGSYIVSPNRNPISNTSIGGVNAIPQGMHVHTSGVNNNYNVYLGTLLAGSGKIWEITQSGVITDRSGAAYNVGTVAGFQACTYGTSVIATFGDSINGAQILLNGSSNFVGLTLSVFNPVFLYCAPIKGNVFGAYCNLTNPYDGIPAGPDPQLVVWSMTDAPRFFGSLRADPQYVGAGYQHINNDLGDINGIIGGDYGLVFQDRGIVRIDGPPYQFYPISSQFGCQFPNSIVRVGSDVYFWSEGGLSKIQYGIYNPSIVGASKFTRSTIDNTTGFSPNYSIKSNASFLSVSAAVDVSNSLLFYSYIGNDSTQYVLAYNYAEDRASLFQMPSINGGIANVLFMQTAPNSYGNAWSVGRNIVYCENTVNAGNQENRICRFTSSGLNGSTSTLGRGYTQFHTDAVTRVRRARPVYRMQPASAVPTFSMSISSTNTPFGADVVTGPYTIQDAHGWIMFNDSIFADFHRPTMTIPADVHDETITEIEGIEFEIEVGGERSRSY